MTAPRTEVVKRKLAKELERLATLWADMQSRNANKNVWVQATHLYFWHMEQGVPVLPSLSTPTKWPVPPIVYLQCKNVFINENYNLTELGQSMTVTY